MTYRETGEKHLVNAVGGGNERLVDRLVQDLGIYSLTVLIERVLDEHYPIDTFGDGDLLIPTWASEHGGSDLDPGVKWIALLRQAIRQVDGATGQSRAVET